MITQLKVVPKAGTSVPELGTREVIQVRGTSVGKTELRGLVPYRPSCPVAVHASANDELPDPHAPRCA